jgi:hypothetical protein
VPAPDRRPHGLDDDDFTAQHAHHPLSVSNGAASITTNRLVGDRAQAE